MYTQLLADQPSRPGAVAEAGKPRFLLSVVHRELGDLEKVCVFLSNIAVQHLWRASWLCLVQTRSRSSFSEERPSLDLNQVQYVFRCCKDSKTSIPEFLMHCCGFFCNVHALQITQPCSLQAGAFRKRFEAAAKDHSRHPCMLWVADISKFEASLAALHSGSSTGPAARSKDGTGLPERPRVLISDPELEGPLPMIV